MTRENRADLPNISREEVVYFSPFQCMPNRRFGYEASGFPPSASPEVVPPLELLVAFAQPFPHSVQIARANALMAWHIWLAHSDRG